MPRDPQAATVPEIGGRKNYMHMGVPRALFRESPYCSCQPAHGMPPTLNPRGEDLSVNDDIACHAGTLCAAPLLLLLAAASLLGPRIEGRGHDR